MAKAVDAARNATNLSQPMDTSNIDRHVYQNAPDAPGFTSVGSGPGEHPHAALDALDQPMQVPSDARGRQHGTGYVSSYRDPLSETPEVERS
jgi:hypothetical protein